MTRARPERDGAASDGRRRACQRGRGSGPRPSAARARAAMAARAGRVHGRQSTEKSLDFKGSSQRLLRHAAAASAR